MPNGRNYGGGHRSSIDLRDSLHYSLACVPKRRADSFFYYSSKIRKTLFDQGGEGRSEHTKGFCPPVCRALRCPSMEPGPRFAPRTSARGLLRAFRRRAPACLLPSLFTSSPQGASARSLPRTRLDGLTPLG